MKHLLHTLGADRSGSVVIEFALIGPTMIAMLFGVLQMGLAMQNYNALRGISADAARYAVVDSQSTTQASTRLNDTQIEAYARNLAVHAPYGLIAQNVTVRLTTPATQRVTGATEKLLEIQYRIPSVLTIIGIDNIPISYSRPIFLIT